MAVLTTVYQNEELEKYISLITVETNQTVCLTTSFMRRRLIVLITAVLATAISLTAQVDSVMPVADSLNAVLLQEYNQKLREIERFRVADSVTRANLEEQLNALKTTDNLKKEELQQKLQALSDAEVKRLQQKRVRIESMRNTAKAYPVKGFFNDTLFVIYSRQGSFSPKERAEAISKRIDNLSEHLTFVPDSLKLVSAEASMDIVFDDNVVMSVTENDALWNNKTVVELANEHLETIRAALIDHEHKTSLLSVLKQIGLALLVILVIIFLIIYTGRLSKWVAHKIQAQEDVRIKGIKIKDYTLFDAKRQVKVLLNFNTIMRWVTVFFVAYFALPVLFGIFPWTRNFAETLIGYILNPIKKMAVGFWNYLPSLITIIVIIVVFRYLLRGIQFLKTEIAKGKLQIPGFYADWANPTFQIIRILVFAFMLVVIFPYLPGSDSPIFKGVTVFLGFLFTFGSAGSLSNVIAGLVLTYMRLFKLGDRVKIGEVTGDVIEKSMLVTRVRTIKNEIISIPNSTVMNSHTINYSSDAHEKGLIINATVTIGYDVPWRQMHQALIDAALRTDLVLKEPHPFVLQTSLEDFYVSYQINAYVHEANKQATIYSDLYQNIQDMCNEQGIEIMSPHYRAARDGSTTTIPESYRSKDYKAPGFNIFMKGGTSKPKE